jgi:type II secretory pathway pseudopilin PulG
MITLPRKTTAGFTMIELLVVATIIIVLTTIGLVSYSQANQNARNGKRKTDLETVRQALVLYRTDQGSYPNTSSWSTMLTTIQDYLANTSVTDPQNVGEYVYEYSTSDGGVTFTACALLEPDPGTSYCVSSP